MQFEVRNTNTRKLEYLQSLLIELDIGLWSGFKRNTELAEGFFGVLVTVSAPSPPPPRLGLFWQRTPRDEE